MEMYNFEYSYMQTIASDLFKYCCIGDSVLAWLQKLKSQDVKILLISGAEEKIALLGLEMCFGQNYKSFFDLIIIEANKPEFFTDRNRFLTLGNVECGIEFNNVYKKRELE